MAADAKDLLIRELKDSVSEQRQMNKTLRTALENSNNQVAELTVQIRLLNEQLDYMKRKLFGRFSEKHAAETDGQLTLFDEPEKEEPVILTAAEISVKSHARKPKAAFEEKTKHLPVERIEIPLPEDEQFCPVCGTPLEVIGKEVVRKELEYIPAALKVVEYVSIHYGCPKCKQDAEKPDIIHSPAPPSLLGSYASPVNGCLGHLSEIHKRAAVVPAGKRLTPVWICLEPYHYGKLGDRMCRHISEGVV